MKISEFEDDEIVLGSRNVYADLGYRDAEAMLRKAQMARKIAEIVDERELTQSQAAKVLGLTQPKISKMFAGQFRGISEAKLMECLARLGRDVQIVVKPRADQDAGRVAVVFQP